MNRKAVAKELLRISRDLLAIDFPSKSAMDKYLEDHPKSNREHHRVVQKRGVKPIVAPPISKVAPKKAKVTPGAAKKLLDVFGGQIQHMTPENIEEMVSRGYFKEGAIEATIEEHSRLKKTNSRKAEEYLDGAREALESASERLSDEKLAERKKRESRPWRRF